MSAGADRAFASRYKPGMAKSGPSGMFDLAQMLEQAAGHHQAGRLDQAERLYHGILNADSNHVEARYRLGVLRAAQGRVAEALELVTATLAGEQACGAVGINVLLYLASQRQLPISEIARCNSGDTAGDRSRVVGYGAFAVHEPGHA